MKLKHYIATFTPTTENLKYLLKNPKKYLFKILACISVFTFFTTQVSLAGDFTVLPTGTYQPTKDFEQGIPDEDVFEDPLAESGSLAATMSFLQSTSPLASVEDAGWTYEYDGEGTLIRATNRVYYPNEQLESIDIYNYENGVRVSRDYDAYYDDGTLKETIDATYHPGTDHYSDFQHCEYRWDGSLSAYEQLAFDATGKQTSYSKTYYHPDGVSIKQTTVYTFVNGYKATLDTDVYDSSGNVEQTTDATYHPNTNNYDVLDDIHYRSDGSIFWTSHMEYEANGYQTSWLKLNYYTDGALWARDSYGYANGVKVSRDYDAYEDDGTLKETIDATYHPGTNYYSDFQNYEYRWDGSLSVYEQLAYDATGKQTSWSKTNYHPDGVSISQTKVYTYVNGYKATLDTDVYDTSGNLTQTTDATYHPNTNYMAVADENRYRSDGTLSSIAHWEYDSSGKQTAWLKEYYRPNGDLSSRTVYTYVNGFKETYHTDSYDTSGILYQTMDATYHPNTNNMDVLDKNYYRWDGTLWWSSHAEFDTNEEPTSSATEHYFADGVSLHQTTVYTYVNGDKATLDTDIYDESGNLEKTNDGIYYPGGLYFSSYEERRYREDESVQSYWSREYDATGKQTSSFREYYYAGGELASRYYYEYENGLRTTLDYEAYDTGGLLTRTYDATFHTNGRYDIFYDYRYVDGYKDRLYYKEFNSSGVILKSHIIVIQSPPISYEPNYTLSYTVDGELFEEAIVLTEGANAIERTVADTVLLELNITLEAAAPDGTVEINGDAVYTTDPDVTLTLTSSGSYQMRFSTDGGTNWTAWEDFAASKILTLPAGDGVKEVQYELKNQSEQISNFSDTIILDTAGPTGSFTINSGDSSTSTKAIVLDITASDAGMGLNRMRFSTDGTNYSAWETFDTTKNLTLSTTLGSHTVYVEIEDLIGNVTQISESITYDPDMETFRQDLINDSLAYFSDGVPAVEPTSGYPHEGRLQRNYTQPTNIGFYAQLLANIITGDIVTDQISFEDAKARLNLMMTSLLSDQQTLGFNGLLPWMKFNGSTWQRDTGTYGQQVVFGDNANLSASLGTAIGALSDPALAGDSTVQTIISQMGTFLDNQEVGYNFLYNSAEGQFRRGWNFVYSYWVGGSGAHEDYFINEFRSGVLFVMLRYNFPDSVFGKMNVRMKDYTMGTGETVFTAAPYDGGAFQVLWPLLTMPEQDNADMADMHQNFVDIALDFAEVNNLDGFLSACYEGVGDYQGSAGISDIAVNTSSRDESATSLYTLGAAYMVDPTAIDTFLRDILTNHPDLMSTHGLWEGYNHDTGQVVQEQIMTNVATFVLGLAGKGPDHMRQYLQDEGLYSRMQSAFSEGTASDLVSGAENAFSWGAGSGYRSGGQYILSSSNFNDLLYTAFIYDSVSGNSNGADVSGRQIRITYTSTTQVGDAQLEFKDKESGLDIRLLIDDLNFENTGGAEKEILIDLPANLGLLDIDEAVLVLFGGSGGSLSLTITDFSIL